MDRKYLGTPKQAQTWRTFPDKIQCGYRTHVLGAFWIVMKYSRPNKVFIHGGPLTFQSILAPIITKQELVPVKGPTSFLSRDNKAKLPQMFRAQTQAIG